MNKIHEHPSEYQSFYVVQKNIACSFEYENTYYKFLRNSSKMTAYYW